MNYAFWIRHSQCTMSHSSWDHEKRFSKEQKHQYLLWHFEKLIAVVGVLWMQLLYEHIIWLPFAEKQYIDAQIMLLGLISTVLFSIVNLHFLPLIPSQIVSCLSGFSLHGVSNFIAFCSGKCFTFLLIWRHLCFNNNKWC